ncbi:ankyrin repeat domain-containing protein 30B-like isoform X3 [Limulus polyphemus]|uniref:Ankyrin repeat domain-containing protein 30B-like isoform X3 n=1 Tax=Limulus polyphemus TaxID=6850 RepID=A0ABM1S730_LIMPO|nr:ankyrin repeat domain-containing protein 30B-like isoform X3 [Limulus polyphemus]
MKKVLKATKIFMSSKKEAKPNAFSDHSNTGLANQRSSTASQGSTWNINSTSLCTSLGYKVDLTLESEDKRFTKLHKACWLGSEDKVKKHIKKIDVNSRDNENRLPLHLATAQGHKSIVEYLIAHKALIDVIDGEGRTPLMKAVECYHADIVEFLLTCGANGNLSDKYGDTSLHLAVRTGQPEVAFTLLKQRLDVNARNAEGWTPLHVATAQRQQNVVKCLLEMGALINSADEEGKTPLMLASKAGNAPLVSLLLSSGANIEMQDNQGWTALDFAALTCKSEIVDILTQNMKTVEESAKESDPESGAHDKDTWNDNDSINEYLNLEQNEPEIVIKEDLPSPVISSSHEPGAPMEVESLEAKERKHGSTEKEFAAVEQRKLDFLKEFGLSDPSEVSTPEISNISDLKEKQNDERSQNIRDDTDIDQDLSTVDEASQHQEGGRISEETDAEKEYLISGTYLTDEDKLQPASEVTKSILKSDWMIAAHSSSESESEVEDIVSPSYIPSASVVRRRSSTHIYSPDVSPTKQPLSFPTTYHSSHPEQTPTSSSPSHSIAPFSKNSVVDSPESPSSKHIYKRKHFSESPETSFHDDKMFGFTSSVGIPPKELMIKEDHALVDPSDVLTDSEWDSEASACSNEENIINKSMNQQENGLEKAKDQETKNMGDSRKREDSYLEQSKETSCPESLEGTLGRPNTLQGSEEMWEKNAIVSVKDVKDSNGEKQEDFPKHLHSFSFSSENSFINVEDSQVATNYNNINADVFSQTTNISAKYIDKTQFVDNQLLCNTRDGGKELDKCIVSCVDEAEETNNKENKYEVEPVFRSLEKSVFDIVQREVCTEARSLENDNPNMLEKIFTEEHNENIHSSITSSKQHDLVEEIFDYQVRDIEHLDSKDNQKVEQTFINQNHVLKFDSKNLQKDTVLLSDTRDVQETVGDSVSCSDSEQICNISNGHGFVSKNNLEVLIHEDNKQFQYDALSTTLGIEKAEEETVSDAVAVFVGDGKNSQSSRVPEKKLPRPTFLNLQESERQSSRPSKTPPKPPPRKTRRVTDEKSPFDVESSLTLTTSPEVEENLQITKLLQGDFDSTTDNEDSITEDSPVPKIPEISPENIRTVNGLQQIQEVLRKQYFIAVKERHDKNNLKSRLNTLKCERSTLQSKLRAEKASHNGLQKKILTLEKELLELKYRIEQEMNSKMDAESLLKTVQNQLTSTLVSYNSETEAKAVLQKQVDSLNKDVKTYNTTIKDLKDEILNWKNKLEEEQSKPSKPLSPSQMKNSNAEEEMVKYATQMKLLEHQNEQYEGENTSLKAQLKILQKELENKEAEWIERIKSITVEREDLENKCEILQKEAAVVHESLDSVSYRYTSNYTNLAEEKEKLENRLAEELKDKEAKEKELNENKAKLKRLEQELAEVQEELRSTRNNLTEQSDKFQKIKIQEHAEKENLLADNSDLKKQLSEATQKVKELKTCLEKNEHDSSLMNMNMHSELDKMQIMFKEKINQSEKLEKEIEEERKKCVRIEIESRHTAEENKKLCDKVNNLQDKLLSQQQEIATLRVQYEDAKVKTVAEKNTNVSSEKCTLDSLLASLRSEHEKFRSMLEEQIESLKITVENLREELKVKDSKLWELELELRQTHREISEYQRELSKLDSTKEISKKTIEEHCLEQSRLRTEISKLQEALQETKQKYGLAETEVKTLQKQLNEAYSVNKNNASKPVLEKELAEVLQRLHKSETHRKNLEATVQKNNKKIEDLGSNLENTSQKKQELENTVKDLKKKNEDLERRLFEAKLTYSVYSREAEESRHLWQHETKTISHLGIKLSEVEKQKKDLEATVTDCQKKVSKALQVKKVAEIRLQQEQDRIQQLKEDIINYKTHLKRAKQKIEDFEKFPAEVRLLTQEREFTQKKEKLLDRISDQRRQIEKLEEQLNKEQVLHHQAEEINRKLSAELVSLRGEEPSQIHQLRAELELLKAGSFKGNLLFPKSLSDSWRPEAHQDHLTKLLNNINTELHNQSLTRDIMEKDRAKSEASIRQDFLRNKNNYMEQISFLQKKLSTKETERGDLEQNLDRLKRKLEAEQLARKSLETQMYATGGSQVVRQLNNLPADSKILNNFRSATVSGSQESVVRRNSQPIQFSTPNSDLPLNSLPVWPSSPVRKHQQEKLGAGLSSSVEAVYPTPLSYHFQAELDKIFKKKLASDPHIDIAIPASISHETKSLDSASDKTASDYLETLQKRYCV